MTHTTLHDTHESLPKRRNHNTPHPFTMKKRGKHIDTTARPLFFFGVTSETPLPYHPLPTLTLSLHTEAKDMHPQTNLLCNQMLTHTHIHNTLAHAHSEKQLKPQNAHSYGHLQVPIAIFFTVFLVNRQLTGLALTKTLAERSICVFVQDGFSKLSLLKLATQPRDHSDKNKEHIEQKQEKISFSDGRRQFEPKKSVAVAQICC